MNFKIFIAIVLSVVFLSKNASTQSKELQKLIDKPKDLWKTIIAPPGRNEIKKWQIKKGYCSEEDYKLPKKVAILSFYIKDDNYTSYYNTSFVSSSSTTKASAAKVNAVTQRIYDQQIKELKEEFAALGIELLEPKEYLTTAELKDIYYNSSLPIMDEKIKAWGLKGNKSATPEGYRLLPLNDIMLNGNKYFNERDGFMEKLGMDAYITIGINLSAAGGLYKRSSTSIDYKNPALGTKTIYRPFHENVYANTKFGRTYSGIWLKEEKEITTKKGKKKTSLVPVDIDPNIALITRYTATAAGKQLKNWLEGNK